MGAATRISTRTRSGSPMVVSSRSCGRWGGGREWPLARRGMASDDEAISPATRALEPSGAMRDELAELGGEVLEIGGRRGGDVRIDRQRQETRALLVRAGLHAADVTNDGGGDADQMSRSKAIRCSST